MLCCRLRTRDEANCREKEFTKPIGFDPRTEIYYRKQLINSIAVEGHNYRVRFCDLTPRAIGLLYFKKSLAISIALTNVSDKFPNLKLLNENVAFFKIIFEFMHVYIQGLIYGDLPVTTTITTETPNQEYASETERDILNTTTRRKAYTTNGLFDNSFMEIDYF